jgi:methyl-accepting chemotaxis protein
LTAESALKKKPFALFFLFAIIHITPLHAQENLMGFDLEVKRLAENCRDEITKEVQNLIMSNQLNYSQMFDTFYVPIPNTNPQKYRTQYDKFTDEVFRPILDAYLKRDKRILFVVAVDRNGYLPTHNTKYSRPLTDDQNFNVKYNRTKRIFNDRTGLSAARNQKPYLLQKYSRDTGEMIADLSVPIIIKGKHWGALRIGYKR